jgi:type IV fimbrial biogenesis protein FimT
MLMRKISQQGVSLIEILIAFSLVALLAIMAVPSYSTWLQNTHIRNAAEGLSNGLQLARAEAVRRNTLTELQVAGAGWVLTLPLTGEQVQARTAAEVAPSVSVVINDLDGDGAADDMADRVTFNGMGWRIANVDASPTIDQVDFSNPAGGTCIHLDADAQMRCMRVVVRAAGSTRMCDPAVAPGDPRAC